MLESQAMTMGCGRGRRPFQGNGTVCNVCLSLFDYLISYLIRLFHPVGIALIENTVSDTGRRVKLGVVRGQADCRGMSKKG